MDVKKTLLHWDMEEEIYMKQLEGFAMKRKKELVCNLKKSMYGLIGDHLIYLVLYVDNMLLIGNNKEIIQDVKT
jgi:hypothetical protein